MQATRDEVNTMDYYQLHYELNEQKRERYEQEADQERNAKLQYKPDLRQPAQNDFTRENS